MRCGVCPGACRRARTLIYKEWAVCLRRALRQYAAPAVRTRRGLRPCTLYDVRVRRALRFREITHFSAYARRGLAVFLSLGEKMRGALGRPGAARARFCKARRRWPPAVARATLGRRPCDLRPGAVRPPAGAPLPRPHSVATVRRAVARGCGPRFCGCGPPFCVSGAVAQWTAAGAQGPPTGAGGKDGARFGRLHGKFSTFARIRLCLALCARPFALRRAGVGCGCRPSILILRA